MILTNANLGNNFQNIFKIIHLIECRQGRAEDFFWGETEGGPPSTQPQPLGLGLPRARISFYF